MDKSIFFSYLDYRDLLYKLIRSKRAYDKKYTLQSLAQHLGVQPPYLSKVLRGHADFTHDQLERILDVLKLAENERDYLILLLDYAKSNYPERKKRLKEKIEGIRESYLSTASTIPVDSPSPTEDFKSEYYLDPINLIIHMALSIPEYQSNIKKLAADFKTSERVVLSTIQNLINWGLVKESEDGLSIAKNLHLPKDNYLTKAHQTLMRLESGNKLQSEQAQADYCLQITFSADQECQMKIKEHFFKFLKKVDEEIAQAPCEKVYQMNFELFNWLEV